MLNTFPQHDVRHCAGGDTERICDALADAFIDDPVYRWLIPGRIARRWRLRVMFAAEIAQFGPPVGTLWTTPRCEGAIIEVPPGAWAMPTTMSGRDAARWLRAFGRRVMVATELQRALEACHPAEPALYVRIVGVASGHQGEGLGTALLSRTLERADAGGLAAYIEASSERSAALYERLGFVHQGVPELPDGCPPVWPMLRPGVS